MLSLFADVIPVTAITIVIWPWFHPNYTLLNVYMLLKNWGKNVKLGCTIRKITNPAGEGSWYPGHSTSSLDCSTSLIGPMEIWFERMMRCWRTANTENTEGLKISWIPLPGKTWAQRCKPYTFVEINNWWQAFQGLHRHCLQWRTSIHSFAFKSKQGN